MTRMLSLLLAAVAMAVVGSLAMADDNVLQTIDALRAKGNLPVGTVVKTEGGPELYLIVADGKAAHIPSIPVLICLGLQDRRPLVISPERLNSLPKTPLLLKNPEGKIYQINGERKRHITNPAVFERRGLDPATVMPLPDAQINCIETGKPLN